MYSTLDVDIRPGLGLGIFEIGKFTLFFWQISNLPKLGTSLWTLLDRLRHLQHVFPQVDVKYDPDSSAITPIVLHIRPHLDLLFSGKYQRLHTICLKNLRDPHPPVTLRFKDTVLSSTEEVLRRVGVSRTFGPTYPGNGLRYPGLWFSFEEEGIAEGLKGNPIDDRTQEVKRILISQKGNDGKSHDALDEVAECSAMAGDVASVVVKASYSFRPKAVPFFTSQKWRSMMVLLYISTEGRRRGRCIFD